MSNFPKQENEQKQETGKGLDDPPCSLFIGGPMDGQKIGIPSDISTIQVPSNDGSCEIYKVELFAADGKLFKVCIHAGLDCSDAMEMLISKYPANDQSNSADLSA